MATFFNKFFFEADGSESDGIFSKAERDRLRMKEHAADRQAGVYDLDSERKANADAVKIALTIHERWDKARGVSIGDNSELDEPDENQANGIIVDDYEPNFNSYAGILYDIVRTNLNDAIRDGEVSAIPMDINLVTPDEFTALMMYDYGIVNSAHARKQAMSSKKSAAFDKTDLELDITAAFQYYCDHIVELYDKFNKMVHGVFHNPDRPRAQFAIDDKQHVLRPFNSLLFNVRRGKSSSAATLVSTTSDITGENGTNAFVITAMLDDAITKIKTSTEGAVLNGAALSNAAADILRFGLKSDTVGTRFSRLNGGHRPSYKTSNMFPPTYNYVDPRDGTSSIQYDERSREIICPANKARMFKESLGLNDTNSVSTNAVSGSAPIVRIRMTGTANGLDVLADAVASGKITQNNRGFLGAIGGPAYLTYDSKKKVVVCPSKLHGIFSAVTGLNRYHTTTTKDSIKGMPVDVIYMSDTSMTLEKLLNDCAYQGILTPIVLEGKTSASLDEMGESKTNLGGDDTGAANGVEDDIVHGLEALKENRINNDPRTLDYIQMVNALKFDARTVRTIRNHFGVDLPSVSELESMPSKEVAEIAATLLEKMIAELSENLGDVITVTRGAKEGHATITARGVDGDVIAPDTLVDISRGVYFNTRTGNVSTWSQNGYAALMNKMLPFMYDASAESSGSRKISEEKFEPMFNMHQMVLSYIENGGNNAFATVVSSFMRDWASYVVEGIRVKSLSELAAELFMDPKYDDSELGNLMLDTPVNSRYKPTIMNIFYKCRDRRQMLSDWLDFIAAASQFGSDDEMIGGDYDRHEDRKMSASQIAAAYFNGNIQNVVSAFPGDLGTYLTKIYTDGAEKDQAELCKLAGDINMDPAYGYVDFDPSVTETIIRDDSGNTVGGVNDIVVPQAVTADKPKKPAKSARRRALDDIDNENLFDF